MTNGALARKRMAARSLPLIMFKRIRHLLCISLCLAACTPGDGIHIDENLAPSERQAPELNANPARLLAIKGTVFVTLGLRMDAIYITDDSAHCRVSSSFLSGVIEGSSGPAQVHVPLDIHRSGREYATSVQVDKFKPGHCGWQFAYVEAHVSKGGLESLENLIVRTHRGGSGEGVESEYENSSSSPVVLRCSFKALEGLGPGMGSNACASPPSAPYKYQHYLTEQDREVVAHFIDRNFRL